MTQETTTHELAPQPLELRDPPIMEVACAFEFDAIPDLTALHLGRIWAEAFAEYPRAMPVAPIPEPGMVQIQWGPPEVRAWYVSEDDSRVVQLQRNRLVYNWRRVEAAAYPRFRTRDAQKGVLDSAIEAFNSFVAWGSEHLEPPRLKALSVTKVDLFERDKHWSTIADLGHWIPALKSHLELQEGEPERIELRIDTREAGIVRTLLLRGGLVRGQIRHLRMETTASQRYEGEVRSQIIGLNSVVNRLFIGQLSAVALHRLGREASQ